MPWCLDKSSKSDSGNPALIGLTMVRFLTAPLCWLWSICWSLILFASLPLSSCSLWSGLCCSFISSWCLSLDVTSFGKGYSHPTVLLSALRGGVFSCLRSSACCPSPLHSSLQQCSVMGLVFLYSGKRVLSSLCETRGSIVFLCRRNLEFPTVIF